LRVLFGTITFCKIGCVDGALYVITKTRIENMKKTFKMTYPKSVVNQILAKYSFDFEFDGDEYRCEHDAKGNEAYTFPEEVGPQLVTLVDKMEELISKIDASTAEVSKFLIKHLQMKVMILDELLQVSHLAKLEEKTYPKK
jgi:hypothetical protein